MKNFAVLCLSLSLFSTIALGGDSIASQLKILSEAKRFSIGGIGEGGFNSEDELTLREILKEKSANSLLQKILKKGTPEAKAYAYFGIHQLFGETFNIPTAIKDFNGVNMLNVQEGCEVYKRPTRDVLIDINDGKYDLAFKSGIKK